ncbi:MAG: putative permease, DMT superfamily [Rhodobacteraceae bacterium HLUCCA12]|nr:MAG: putative permease, DMT superfamily [Rhodobacteraceae bacterium HLUCCA12]
MRLFVLSALVMVAFAANSLLNRAALADELIAPLPFAVIRVIAGALVLALLVRERPRVGWPQWGAALALSVYLVGFSLAYVALDAGIGALILFGMVQVTMLAGAIAAGERPGLRRLAGAALALAGLGALLLPGAQAVPAPGVALVMVAAAVGWGLYSLAGRGAARPLATTATNFALAVPLVTIVSLPWLSAAGMTAPGVALAIVSGAVTSGLGYALWYAVLPALGAVRAAAAQLSVPVIALAGGVALLGESLTPQALAASAIVLAGVALASLPGRPRA